MMFKYQACIFSSIFSFAESNVISKLQSDYVTVIVAETERCRCCL